MPATVIAERIDWPYTMNPLRARLTAVDVDGRTRLNSATLRTTLNTARRTRLALRSNAPNRWPPPSNAAIGSATSTIVSTAAGCGDSNPSRAHSPTR